MADLIRQTALTLLKQVLRKNQTIDDAFEAALKDLSLEKRDKAFLRLLTTTTVRRIGQIDALLSKALSKPLPVRGQTAMDILRIGTAQLMFLNTPPHAAINTSVDLAKAVGQDFYAGLINGVLRTLTRAGKHWFSKQDAARLNTPDWLWQAWCDAYGTDKTRAIALANLTEPTFDITVKDHPEKWAKELGGFVTSTGSVRVQSLYQPQTMPGFADGGWWVQDSGASLAVQTFDDLTGKKTADFCAAPGGKTAQLITRGAIVDAFDISKNRMKRVEENLKRLHLSANLIVADAAQYPGQALYDAILIDAPCSATGTIRRHPELLLHRTQQDVINLTRTQHALLCAAHRLLKPNGELVYCTCSLQHEEGEERIQAVANLFDVKPIASPFATSEGFIRTFPDQAMDGFFIAHLRKKESSCL